MFLFQRWTTQIPGHYSWKYPWIRMSIFHNKFYKNLNKTSRKQKQFHRRIFYILIWFLKCRENRISFKNYYLACMGVLWARIPEHHIQTCACIGRGSEVPWNCSYLQLCTFMSVLGVESWSSQRAVGALNNWAIFPALKTEYFTHFTFLGREY